MQSEICLQSVGRTGVKEVVPGATSSCEGRLSHLQQDDSQNEYVGKIQDEKYQDQTPVQWSRMQSRYHLGFKRNTTLLCCRRLVRSGDIRNT